MPGSAKFYTKMPVKKAQLAERLAEKFGISKKQSAEWLDAFTDEITKVLRSGDKVNITGFGIFKVADRKAREGINPKTGEKIHIAASKKPRFTAGKLLKEAVKG
jgi:DNA-binding protein HU-beta